MAEPEPDQELLLEWGRYVGPPLSKGSSDAGAVADIDEADRAAVELLAETDRSLVSADLALRSAAQHGANIDALIEKIRTLRAGTVG